MKKIVLIISMALLVACQPTTKNKEQVDTKQTEVKTPEKVSKSKIEKKTPTLAESLPVLEQESEERYFKGRALVINFLPMDIAMGQYEPLLKKLFPRGKISNAESTEVIDAFNITQDNKEYSVAVSYGKGSDSSFVIDKFYIFERKFSIDLLNDVLNK